MLEPIAAGEHLTMLALSESATGAQFWMPRTKLCSVDDGYVVDGRKTFVTTAVTPIPM